MPIEGHMINGKFMDLNGTIYKFVPEDAVILDIVGDPTGTPGTQGPPPQAKEPPKSTPPPAAPETPTATPAAPAAQELITTEPANITQPKCISYELLKAIQTPSQAQASVRAHCDGQFADGVIHYDFEVYRAAFKKESPGEAEIALLKFKQTALQAAYKLAARMARDLLYEQDQKTPEV